MTFRGTNAIEDHAKRQKRLTVRKRIVVIGVALALASSIAAWVVGFFVPAIGDPEIQVMSRRVYQQALVHVPSLDCDDWSLTGYSVVGAFNNVAFREMRFDTCQSERIAVEWREVGDEIVVLRVTTAEGDDVLFERAD